LQELQEPPTVTASTMIAQVMGCGQGWMSQELVKKYPLRKADPYQIKTTDALSKSSPQRFGAIVETPFDLGIGAGG
jgi:hypothetical protein